MFGDSDDDDEDNDNDKDKDKSSDGKEEGASGRKASEVGEDARATDKPGSSSTTTWVATAV